MRSGLGELRSALVSDALDRLGVPGRWLGPGLVPLLPGSMLVGRAFTVTVERADAPGDPPYRGLLRALDAIGRDDVYVVSSAPQHAVALWGELMATAALARGAAGAVCDGFVRDVARLRAIGLPVISRGAAPCDIDGRLEVVGHGEPVTIGGVTVDAGDLVVADDDGVVVVPRETEAEAIALATEKATAESAFRTAVNGGMAPSEAFALHNVL